MKEVLGSLWANIFKKSGKGEKAVREVLRQMPMFKDLKNRELFQLERILHRRDYNVGETIFNQGDPGLGMYIIEEGVVDIVAGSERQQLAELKAGDFFGELALLDDTPRTAAALAKTPCRLLCFFQPDLFDLLERTPRSGIKILFNLARILGERLIRANESLQDLRKDGRV